MESFSKRYFDLLTNEYKGINLTRIIDFDDFQAKQIEDSILPLQVSQVFRDAIDKAEIVVDVGFGGGFPLLPLANELPEKKFLGVETRGKKVNVVREISQSLGLHNVGFIHARIEEVLVDKPAVITFKAVGKVHDFLSKINANKPVKVFFYKGPNFYTLEADQIELAQENWNVIEEKSIEVPGTEGRLIIGFESKNVPCGTATKSANQLVKVSSIK